MTVHHVQPSELQDALNNNSLIRPGDTIFLAGIYSGEFTCTLRGNALNKITIDGQNQTTILGSIWFMDGSGHLIVKNNRVKINDWIKRTLNNEQEAEIYPPIFLTPNYPNSYNGGFRIHCDNSFFINNKISDQYIAHGFWNGGFNSTIYGSRLFHNGWYDEFTPGDRNHGEGIYTQNPDNGTTKTIRHCVGWNNFDHNLAIYGTNEEQSGYRILDNIWFNDGMQFGGHVYCSDLLIDGNYFYATNDIPIGFSTFPNVDVTLTNNYFCMRPDHFRGLWFNVWETVNFQNNFVIGNETSYPVVIQHAPANWSDWTWDNNTYYYVERTPDLPGEPFLIEDVEFTYAQWKTETGYDTNSTFTVGKPPNKQSLLVNEYGGNSMIALYNWSLSNTLTIDLSGLSHGHYLAYNVQNYNQYFGFDYYGNDVIFPMNSWTADKPFNYSQAIETISFPEFGVFELELKQSKNDNIVSVDAIRRSHPKMYRRLLNSRLL